MSIPIPNGMFGRRYFGARYFGRAQEGYAIKGSVLDAILLNALLQKTEVSIDYAYSLEIDSVDFSDVLVSGTVTLKAGATGLCELILAGNQTPSPNEIVSVVVNMSFDSYSSADAILFIGRVIEPTYNEQTRATTVKCDDAVGATYLAYYRAQFVSNQFGGANIRIADEAITARTIQNPGYNKVGVMNLSWINPDQRPDSYIGPWTINLFAQLGSPDGIGITSSYQASSEADFYNQLNKLEQTILVAAQRILNIDIPMNPLVGLGYFLTSSAGVDSAGNATSMDVGISGIKHSFGGKFPITSLEAVTTRDIVSFQHAYGAAGIHSYTASEENEILSFWAAFNPARAVSVPTITVTIGGAGSGSFTISKAPTRHTVMGSSTTGNILQNLDIYGSSNQWSYAPSPSSPDLCSGAKFGSGVNTFAYSVDPDYAPMFYLKRTMM